MRTGGIVLVAALAAMWADRIAGQPSPPSIVVEPADRDGIWAFTWQADAPIEALRFVRPAAHFRENVWTVVTPGYEFSRDGDVQVIRATGEAPRADRVTVHTPVFTEHLPKEYEAFQRFSDGGIALYTGHLLADAMVGGEAHRACDFVFRAPAGSRAVIGGRVVEGEARWRDPHGSGTYVYIGDAEPVATEHLVAVIDRGLPAWVRKLTAEALPALFELYTAWTGFPLTERPVVLVGWEPTPGTGLSSGGGTLPNLIQLGLQGGDWSDETAEAREHLFDFVAHEAAHMWNGQMVHPRDYEEAWMHEGGAELFAGRALVDLGVITAEREIERATDALNECAQVLGGRPLRSAGASGDFRAYYVCGRVMGVWTDVVLERGGSGVVELWTRLIEVARARSDRGYNQGDYAALVAELGGPEDAAEVLAGFTEREHGSSGEYLADMLRAAGVDVSTDTAAADAAYRRTMGRQAFAALMREDCDGGLSFHNLDDRVRTAGGPTCATLTAELDITTVEGAAIYAEGHHVYDRVRARCAAGETAEIGLADGGSLSVPCDARLGDRPPLYRIGGR